MVPSAGKCEAWCCPGVIAGLPCGQIVRAPSDLSHSPFAGPGEEAECASGPDDRGAVSPQQPGIPPLSEEAAPGAEVYL